MQQINPATSLTTFTTAQPVTQAREPTGFDALGQGDFLRLLVTQLEQQDPLEPVDNKDMLAQMAQFSSLAGTTETNDTLQQILSKLDTLIAVQVSSQTAATAIPVSNQE